MVLVKLFPLCVPLVLFVQPLEVLQSTTVRLVLLGIFAALQAWVNFLANFAEQDTFALAMSAFRIHRSSFVKRVSSAQRDLLPPLHVLPEESIS